MKVKALAQIGAKWAIYLTSAMFLLSMISAPAIALIAARNSVSSQAIINGQVRSRDIGKRAIKNRNIGLRAVRDRNITNDAIRGRHIKDGSIYDADIASNANISASKINSSGLNADILDGSHASAFSTSNHNHDANYSGVTHSHDSSYSASDHDHDTDYSGISHNHVADYSATGHDHNTNYYTKAQSNANYADGSHSHETTKTGLLAIPAAALSKHINYSFALEDGYAFGDGTSWNGLSYADAPVILPDGAVITKLEYETYDDNASNDSRVMLYRWSTASDDPEIMAEKESSGSTLGWQTLDTRTISNPVIDNSTYGYFVQVRLHTSGDSIRVATTRITYEYISP